MAASIDGDAIVWERQPHVAAGAKLTIGRPTRRPYGYLQRGRGGIASDSLLGARGQPTLSARFLGFSPGAATALSWGRQSRETGCNMR